MPPLPGPILETRGLTMLMRGILRMTVRVLRTLRQTEGDGRPLSLLRPLSPRLAAKRAVRGGTLVRGHVRKPRWSRSRKLELSEIGSHASSHASSAVPTSYGSGGEIALVPCRRATVKRPTFLLSRDALRVAKASLLSEGIDPRGKVTKRAKEVMDQWKLEGKERFEQEKKRARQGEAQRRNHEQSLRPSAEPNSD